MHKKKGISDVITVVLMILLVVASVVIIWSLLRPTIEKGVGKISGACVSLDLEVRSCTKDPGNAQNVNVSVKRGAADVDLQDVLLIFDLQNGNTNVSTIGGIGNLETKKYTLNSLPNTPISVTVTGRVKTEGGEVLLCQPTSVKANCN